MYYVTWHNFVLKLYITLSQNKNVSITDYWGTSGLVDFKFDEISF